MSRAIQARLLDDFDVAALRATLSAADCWRLLTEHIDKLEQLQVLLHLALQRHGSGSHGIQHPRPEAAQPLASDGEGDGGSGTAQPLATGGDGDGGSGTAQPLANREGGGDGGSDTAQPLASAGSNTRHVGRKQLMMRDFFRA